MALLLPFYILKIRKELDKKSIDSAKCKALSKELESYIVEIDKILKRCKEKVGLLFLSLIVFKYQRLFFLCVFYA
jgi:predicted DNA-binding protein (UPF0278 family)